MPSDPSPNLLLGHVAEDGPQASNERIVLHAPQEHRARIIRNQFVTIADARTDGLVFLGRVLGGPFFPQPSGEGVIVAELEVQGELADGEPRGTNNRPTPGSTVHELPPQDVCRMLGLRGDMVLGTLIGREDLEVGLQSTSKDVLPRNVGIFGTVGSGKSNSVQVLVEEASQRGWAVIMLDLESEYTAMDAPSTQAHFGPRLERFGLQPRGLNDFHVYHPLSCASDCQDSNPFTLRLADFDSSITAELLQASMGERNALLDCIDHFQQKFYTSVRTSDVERHKELLDSSPSTRMPFTVQLLRNRAQERSPRNSESLDYIGLTNKLLLLIHSGAFDQPNAPSMDIKEMLQPGRVNVIDVSAANDLIKNLVTADLLRKSFAYKCVNPDAPPTMLVIEEAHSFMSKERVQAMQGTLQMLRNVARRGRKRWLSLTFVSQQPGHLPVEIFELCNTRIVHTLRSMHNLDSLMATTGDVTRELWARCPLLGTGEAIISTPQFHRSVVVEVRPAASARRFVR
ncbi:MAG: ATP-binding protein [Gemmataceae bacterium]